MRRGRLGRREAERRISKEGAPAGCIKDGDRRRLSEQLDTIDSCLCCESESESSATPALLD